LYIVYWNGYTFPIYYIPYTIYKVMLYIGSDHRGFQLKEGLKNRLGADGVEVDDLGDDKLDPGDDYPVYAEKVAKAVVQDPEHRGIVLCGSGVGVDMVANKVDGVRCALVQDEERVKQSREHEDINMLALPADIVDEETAYKMVKLFLETLFSGEERHKRRLHEVEEVESKN
jgi:ribose 5-phosphate isomerase B